MGVVVLPGGVTGQASDGRMMQMPITDEAEWSVADQAVVTAGYGGCVWWSVTGSSEALE